MCCRNGQTKHRDRPMRLGFVNNNALSKAGHFREATQERNKTVCFSSPS